MLEFLRIDPHVNLQSLLSEASAIRSDARIDVTEQDLATPGDMPAKIRAASARQGVAVGNSPAAIVRCVLDSLADAYGEAVKALEKVSGVTVSAIQIVGGGSQNDLLSQLTADATGKKVIAGPVEATALGNLMSQAGAHGAAGSDLESQREIIRASFSPKIFKPSNINQQRKVNV
jgi:rhamnulokinase